MTTKQQPRQQSEQSETPVTADTLSTDDILSLLDEQATIDPQARGDAYIPIPETNLPVVAPEALTSGMLLYDPRDPTLAFEVVEQYQDDYGNEKVRVRIHSDDYQNNRLNSYFLEHIPRDLTFLQHDNNRVADIELSVDAVTSAWDGATTNDDTETLVQTTLDDDDSSSEGETDETTDETTQTLVTETPEEPVERTQETLF